MLFRSDMAVDITIPETINYNDVNCPVTSISSKAFVDCTSLACIRCKTLDVPALLGGTTFEGTTPSSATLYVASNMINAYKITESWSNFGDIVDLTVIEPIPCAIPTISYINGQVVITCETEDVEFKTNITADNAHEYEEAIFDFTAIYTITTYAVKKGYANSDVVTATLCWIENGDGVGDVTGIINIPAAVALITSTNGTVTISYPLNGEAVVVYTTEGAFVGTTTIENGSATIATGLSKGTIAIVTIGEKSIKVII